MKESIVVLIFASFIITSCVNTSVPISGNTTSEQSEPTTLTSEFSSPTSVSTNLNETLSEDSLNKVIPKDIIQEIAYFGGLGGGGNGCYAFEDSVPTFLDDYTSLNTPVEVFSYINTDICGLSKDEKVEISAQLPDGSIRKFQAISQQYEGRSHAEINFEYIPNLHDPLGEHTLIFSGNDWELQRKIQVTDANSARLYFLDNNKIIFYKFQPEEHVRLFAYQYMLSADEIYQHEQQNLIGWQEYKMGLDGELTINAAMENLTRYVAVGDDSGQVIYRLPNYDLDYSYWAKISASDFYCPGAPNPIGLKPNQFAEITSNGLPYFTFDWQYIDGSDKINNANQIGVLPAGAIVKLASNPICFDSTWWWGVNYTDSYSKYVQETNAGSINLRSLTNNSTDSEIPFCQGTKPTRLKTSMNAEVTTSGMAPQLSIRALPSMSAEKVHVIAAGRDLVILDGPVCADSSYWWYIRSEQGFEGWAREGDNEDYWIDPLP